MFAVHTICPPRGGLAPWLDVGVDCRKEASIAKAGATNRYFSLSDVGTQILGGYWLTPDFQMEQHGHDPRLMRIGGGAGDVMRISIAKDPGP